MSYQRSTNHYITKLKTGRFSLVMYLCITKMPLTTHNTNKSITRSDLKLEFCSIIMTIMTHQETVMLDVHRQYGNAHVLNYLLHTSDI
jgi:hypothetical protein